MTVFPVASAWATLVIDTSKGKFHGTMAPTTPAGSLTTRREFMLPRMSRVSPMSVSQA